MFGISYFFPADKPFEGREKEYLKLEPWKHTTWVSLALVVITITIYILLGNV